VDEKENTVVVVFFDRNFEPKHIENSQYCMVWAYASTLLYILFAKPYKVRFYPKVFLSYFFGNPCGGEVLGSSFLHLAEGLIFIASPQEHGVTFRHQFLRPHFFSNICGQMQSFPLFFVPVGLHF